MPIFSRFTRLRWLTSTITGTSRTTPTSKNSGRPTRAATPAIAHGSALGRTRPTTASTMRSAPPESASNPPIMAPSAISSPTLPTVVPTPVVKLSMVLVTPRPATTPRAAVPKMRARNGCTFSQVISTMTTAMATTAAMISCASLDAGTVAAVTRCIRKPPRAAPAASRPRHPRWASPVEPIPTRAEVSGTHAAC